jgi:5-methyltetrahydropteroyltriglutamate--homocysteine methyltransferase
MTASTRIETVRADVVGSLLRPDYLHEARQALHEGRIGRSDLRAVEDGAVHEAIALQEAAALDVITDGEMRRTSWGAPPLGPPDA